jgi:hypothetical protein
MACLRPMRSRSCFERATGRLWRPKLGPVDVLQGLPQVPPFATLDAKAAEVDIGGLSVRVCSLEHLLAMKRASERLGDQADLEALEAIQDRGDEGR